MCGNTVIWITEVLRDIIPNSDWKNIFIEKINTSKVFDVVMSALTSEEFQDLIIKKAGRIGMEVTERYLLFSEKTGSRGYEIACNYWLGWN